MSLLSHAVAKIAHTFCCHIGNKNVKGGLTNQGEDTVANASSRTALLRAVAVSRAATADAYSAKGLRFAQAKAAKIQRVQESFIVARKGKGLFGLKD